MFCWKCGTQLEDGSTYCHKCGSYVGESVGNGLVIVPDSDKSANHPNAKFKLKNIKLKKAQLIGIAALAVIVVLALVVVFGGKGSVVGTWAGRSGGYYTEITFTPDGREITNVDGMFYQSTYSVKGNILTLTSTGGGKNQYTFRLFNRKNTLQISGGGINMTLHRQSD